MKKLISALLCITIIFAFVGCSKAEKSQTDEQPTQQTEEQNQTIETILTPAEYVLYQNIFYNEQAGDYVGKEQTKTGIFTILIDEYNSTTRYYVWGYNDNTKCCDWQWEFVPIDKENLPTPGSTVNITGTFNKNESALDGYWIENASVEVTKQYKTSEVDIDTTTMGGTLERVQVMNFQEHADKFEGKTVKVYGRIEGANSIQHPYYDNCFSQEFQSNDDVLAIGTKAVVTGKYEKGIITNATVVENNDF